MAFDIGFSGDSGAVDQNIYAPEFFADLIYHGFDLLFIGDINAETGGIFAN